VVSLLLDDGEEQTLPNWSRPVRWRQVKKRP
jgi:hypothetical protein